jgi:hypothetical protein
VAGSPSTNRPAAAAAEKVAFLALISGCPGRKLTVTYTTGMPALRAALIALDSRCK